MEAGQVTNKLREKHVRMEITRMREDLHAKIKREGVQESKIPNPRSQGRRILLAVLARVSSVVKNTMTTSLTDENI